MGKFSDGGGFSHSIYTYYQDYIRPMDFIVFKIFNVHSIVFKEDFWNDSFKDFIEFVGIKVLWAGHFLLKTFDDFYGGI